MNESRSTLTPYEQSALDDVAESLSPYRTPVSTLVHLMSNGEAEAFAPAEPDVMAHGLWRILSVFEYLAARTVRSERLRDLRRLAMRPLRSVTELAHLDLWEVDETARWVEPKYALAGALLGLGSGGFGLRGMAIGKPLLMWLAMRQISEYGTRYGFDMSLPEERTFATQIFVAALCPRKLARDAGPEDLTAVTNTAKRVSRFAGVFDVVRGVVRRVVRSRAEVRSRKEPIVVAVGVAIYSAWFLRGIAQTAAIAYRERFIARKYHVPVAELEPLEHLASRQQPHLPRPPHEPHEPDEPHEDASKESMPPTRPSRSEVYPPGPFERKDEARRASAKAGAAR